MKGNLNIGLRCVDIGPPYYGIVFEPVEIPGKLKAMVPCNITTHSNSARCNDGRNQPLMLPHNVECVEIKKVRVPSRPRLQLFDNFLIGSGKQTYIFYSPVFRMKERGATPVDGKLSVFGVREASALGEDIDEHIQAAPEAINDQPGLNAHKRWQALHIGEFVNLLGTLRIKLFDNFIWGECAPRADARFQNFELGIGPINPSHNV
jgi:hypothetical protein